MKDIKIWHDKVYECHCGSEVLILSKEDEGKDWSPMTNIAFFNQGIWGLNCLTWKERIRHAWCVLTKGTLWADMVILDPFTCYKLGKDLIEIANRDSAKLQKECKEMENLKDICPVCQTKNINLLADMCEECSKECDKDDTSV